MLSFQGIYDSRALAGYYKQHIFLDSYEETPWEFDKSTASFRFDDGRVYCADLLGVETRDDGRVWCWGWAINDPGFPGSKSAAALKRYGEICESPLLTNAEIPLDELTGVDLAILGLGHTGAKSFFPLNVSESKTFWFLLSNNTRERDFRSGELATWITQAIGASKVVDQAFAVGCLMEHLTGTEVLANKKYEIVDSTNTRLECKFDDNNRLVGISAKVVATATQ